MGFARLLAFVRAWLGDAPLSPRRAAGLAGFLAGYPLLEVLTWLAWVADRLLLPGARRTVVRAPVFIVGNFRSGTTFLHRLLAEDAAIFTTMPLWESLFAPSLLAKRLLRPLFRAGARARRRRVHDVALGEPEEDDYLLLHCFSALTVGLASGLPRLAAPFVRFDQFVPDRRRLMKFYKACVRKHLADAPKGRRYLAKNPAMTPKLRTLLEAFPDARVIVLERDPREMLPSMSSMMRVTWRLVGVPEGDAALRGFLEDMAEHWYAYPREVAQAPDSGHFHFVRYEDLTRNPAGTVAAIYAFLGERISPDYASRLAAERPRQSLHRYTLEGEGFDRAAVESRFAAWLAENQDPPNPSEIKSINSKADSGIFVPGP